MIQDKFDFLMWRSLQEGVSCPEMVANLVSFLSQGRNNKGSLTDLINYLRRYKCLLILDGLESILAPNNHQGKYQETAQDYGELVELLGTTSHLSSIIITSREKPEKINFLEEPEGKIRSFHLQGNSCDLFTLKLNKKLNKTPQNQDFLCDYYGHNYILLDIITKYINQLFNDESEEFLTHKTRLFDEVYSFITQHFDRLSSLEIMIINQFQDEENFLSLTRLQEQTSCTKIELWQGLQSLMGRSLIIQDGSSFTIVPIIKEYLKYMNR